MAKKTLAQIMKDVESLSDEEKQKVLETEYMTDDDIQPLVTNKEKILKELKDAKERISKLKLDENDKALLTKIKESGIMDTDELDKIVNSGTTDLEKAQSTIKRLEAINNKLTKDSETYKNSFQSERQQRLDVAKKNIISGELAKLNVNPTSMDILQDHFSNKLAATVGEDGKISVVSKEDEITPAGDIFKSWSETEQSKQFIKAPINSGGGASGANGDSSSKLTLEQISKLPTREERTKAMADAGL